jgi:hypothetical protein
VAADYFEAKDMLGDLGRAVALLHSSHRFPAHRLLNTLHHFFTSPKTKVNKMFCLGDSDVFERRGRIGLFIMVIFGVQLCLP